MSCQMYLNFFIILLSICHIKETSGWNLPKDVEMMEGYNPPPSWKHDGGLINVNSGGAPERLVKAIRNRRALTYHIKSMPSFINYEINDGDSENRHFQKRDLADALSKMDVSAQYMEQLAINRLDPRTKREIIEEEDVKRDENKEIETIAQSTEKEWIPQPSTKEDVNVLPSEAPSTYSNAEPLLDRQNGREARGATKDQWVKLPYLGRPLESEQLSTSISNTDEINHRMPRVNFVTQNKGLQTSETRNQRESIPRNSYSHSSDLRTDIYPPGRDGRARSMDYSTYSRRSYYYPDDYRRRGYDDMDYYDDFYYNQRRDPYDRYDPYRNGRRYDYSDYRYRGAYDRYDDGDYGRYDKPRRIIYYATLPDVVRTPPNVYRYPHSRYDDDRYNRDNRYDNTYNRGYYSRYPYSALKKAENEGPRDLSTSSTATKEKAAEDQKRQQEQQKKIAERSREGGLNSHQYPINLATNLNVDSSKTPHQTLYHDITRIDNDFHRYDHPSFQAAVDDPYVSRHD